MEVKRLRPYPPANLRVTPETQCEMPLREMNQASKGPDDSWRKRHFAKRGLDSKRCAKGFYVDFNGRKLCALHAGQLALMHLLGDT